MEGSATGKKEERLRWQRGMAVWRRLAAEGNLLGGWYILRYGMGI